MYSLKGELKSYLNEIRSGGQLPIVYAGVMDQYNQIVSDTNGGVIYSSVREVL